MKVLTHNFLNAENEILKPDITGISYFTFFEDTEYVLYSAQLRLAMLYIY